MRPVDEMISQRSGLYIHTEDLENIRAIAEQQAKGRPPIVLSEFLTSLEGMAQMFPQTTLELLRKLEHGEQLTPGAYE